MKKILGYTNAWSVAPGETLRFMVSAYGPERYRADLVRVICGDDDPDRDIYREEEIEAPFNGEYPGRRQPIDVGSCAAVPDSPALAGLRSFTVLSWVWPTTPDKGEQALVSRWKDDPAAGFALLIDAAGALALRVGDGRGGRTEVSTGSPLTARRWYLWSTTIRSSISGHGARGRVPDISCCGCSCGACGREARECGQGGGQRDSVVHRLVHTPRPGRQRVCGGGFAAPRLTTMR